MTHNKGPQQEAKRREALDVCIDGLEDDDTHLSRSFPLRPLRPSSLTR